MLKLQIEIWLHEDCISEKQEYYQCFRSGCQQTFCKFVRIIKTMELFLEYLFNWIISNKNAFSLNNLPYQQ